MTSHSNVNYSLIQMMPAGWDIVHP